MKTIAGGGNSGFQCHTASQLHEKYPALHMPFSVTGSTLDGRVDYWANSFDSNGPRLPMTDYCSPTVFPTKSVKGYTQYINQINNFKLIKNLVD